MVAVQSENALSPKPQHLSRAPSPVPSAFSSGVDLQQQNHSSPKLPLPISSRRRSSFSAEVSNDQYERKPLISQRSFPHLTSKKHQHRQRRGSDTISTDDMGSDGGFSISASAASSAAALPISTRFANDKRNNDFHTLFRSVPDQERLIDARFTSIDSTNTDKAPGKYHYFHNPILLSSSWRQSFAFIGYTFSTLPENQSNVASIMYHQMKSVKNLKKVMSDYLAATLTFMESRGPSSSVFDDLSGSFVSW
ncbi:hypothetical protein [Parasitella parasitica]|uniref:Uncharacterized protein n=1 Tax=Parasitella parasitica TaxID=35722 RepID=A0A0B7N3T8_9FUNG|nr:hypothetical protein [Parasitella parasitica]